jgi:hypothetical protein
MGNNPQSLTGHTAPVVQAAVDNSFKKVEVKNAEINYSYWNISYWILMCLWIVGALLFMNEVNAGFFNSYLSDLTFPPWFYIQLRGLHRKDRRPTAIPIIGSWFGINPLRAGISIFMVGLISELLMLVWPKNLTSGTFDKNDIIAYAFSLVICVTVDLRRKI